MNLTDSLIEKVETFGAHNYHPLPLVLQRGSGSNVVDVDGKSYLDFLSCYSALNFGHQHPRIVTALKTQLEKLAVCSRAFYAEEFGYFSEELARFVGLDMVLAMNSGAEACETAIKIARKWGYEKKRVEPDKANIICLENNFHGRTVTIISFSTDPCYRDGFGPFTPGFTVVPFDDISAVEKVIDANTVGVFLEPIQAEAGILIPQEGYLKSLRKLCDAHGILLMVDEIQTGLGRTGADFCYQHENIKPDLLILGKSLGGGLLPISAVVGPKNVMEVIKPGQHGSTFGGNPLACAVGKAALQVLREERLSDRAAEMGKKTLSKLSTIKSPLIKEIRGKGLLIGIELTASAGGARKYCEKLATRGVLCKETHDNVIRIAPPLTIEEPDLDRGIDEIIQVISNT
ncbi:MAG: ornithine--oxo-acid transaminase [Proteobacteria bacterium]|nr:ornithine--oxo-acid transaminase [Pseudomonadota bacterium]NDC24401.1 ornithine--oxo-acid transaminase [Pseudomonadota bacterium]NDD04363.1 ornithine--oxo-acid transaminase [Pseudomonadota bacterium]